jgi:hypothetical protein
MRSRISAPAGGVSSSLEIQDKHHRTKKLEFQTDVLNSSGTIQSRLPPAPSVTNVHAMQMQVSNPKTIKQQMKPTPSAFKCTTNGHRQ